MALFGWYNLLIWTLISLHVNHSQVWLSSPITKFKKKLNSQNVSQLLCLCLSTTVQDLFSIFSNWILFLIRIPEIGQILKCRRCRRRNRRKSNQRKCSEQNYFYGSFTFVVSQPTGVGGWEWYLRLSNEKLRYNQLFYEKINWDNFTMSHHLKQNRIAS